MTLEQEIAEAIKRLNELPKKIGEDRKKFLEYSAIPVVAECKKRAPVGTRQHKRYKDKKVVATYNPGNLKASIRVLDFKRSNAVFVGPLAKGKTGTFGPARPSAFYARFVEFGTKNMAAQPYMRPGAAAGLPIALQRIKNAITIIVRNHAAKYAGK